MGSTSKKIAIVVIVAGGSIFLLNRLQSRRAEQFGRALEEDISKGLAKWQEALDKTRIEMEGNKKYWSRDSVLTWSDFLEAKDSAHADSAGVSGKIGCHVEEVNDSINVTVHAFIRRDLCWVKPGNQTPALLRHEQGHFNLLELFAREIRRRIINRAFESPARTNTVAFANSYGKIADLLRNIYHEEYERMRWMQTRYDSITNHSRNGRLQKQWEEEIALMLDSLKDYSDTTITLKFQDHGGDN